eukprot:3190530-Amphidinium_carterae.1
MAKGTEQLYEATRELQDRYAFIAEQVSLTMVNRGEVGNAEQAARDDYQLHDDIPATQEYNDDGSIRDTTVPTEPRRPNAGSQTDTTVQGAKTARTQKVSKNRNKASAASAMPKRPRGRPPLRPRNEINAARDEGEEKMGRDGNIDKANRDAAPATPAVVLIEDEDELEQAPRCEGELHNHTC